MDSEIEEILQQKLSKLCYDLNCVLKKTEVSLSIAKERFNQVKSVLDPWEIEQISTSEQESTNYTCTCSENVSNINESGDGDDQKYLMESISKTLSNAETLRKKTSKPNVTFAKETGSISRKVSTKTISSHANKLKSKSTSSLHASKSSHSTKTIPIKAKSSKSSTSSKTLSTHAPSCPLYNLDNTGCSRKPSSLSLSEAVSSCKIPLSLSRILKQYKKYVLEVNNPVTSPAKNKDRDRFLYSLEKRNEEFWSSDEVNHPVISSLPKYISSLHSLEYKKRYQNITLPCILYSKIEDLHLFEDLRVMRTNSELWNNILKLVISDILPVIKHVDLDSKQKLYIYKIIHTICSLTGSNIPNVPIFRLNYNK